MSDQGGGARRQRRLRARQRVGVVMPYVAVTDTVVELLIDLGWLELAVSEDREQIGLAIGKMLAASASQHRNTSKA